MDPGDRAADASAERRIHLPLAYLRAFLVMLVVVHHVAQGYQPFLPEASAESLADHLLSIRGITPVIDPARSGLVSLFSALNDAFFMALLFLISGLFVSGSLRRYGALGVLRARLLRLGVPLLVMIVIRPLSYYPTYLQTGGDGGLVGFWQAWRAIEWRGGPLWFLELLLLFDLCMVACAPGIARLTEAFQRREPTLSRSALRCFGVLVVASALAYIPLSLVYGPFAWIQVGPAQLQINRVLHHAVYFLLGVWLGANGIDRTFLAVGSPWSRRFGWWIAAALAAFGLSIGLSVGGAPQALAGLGYVLASASLSFAWVAVFLRFVHERRPVLDSGFRNSLGIYVFHYGFVSWLLLAGLGLPLPAIAKWVVLSVLAVALSWGTTSALRRVPGVARVL